MSSFESLIWLLCANPSPSNVPLMILVSARYLSWSYRIIELTSCCFRYISSLLPCASACPKSSATATGTHTHTHTHTHTAEHRRSPEVTVLQRWDTAEGGQELVGFVVGVSRRLFVVLWSFGVWC